MEVKRKIKKVLSKFKRVVVVKEPVYIPCLEGNILANRNVLITGGSSGIGLCVARECVKNGASVVICGRNSDKLDKAAASLDNEKSNAAQTVKACRLAITDVGRLKASVDELTLCEPLDTLVNSAGISGGGIIGKTTEEGFDRVIDTNLKGTYFISQYFSNYLIDKGIKGNILNISSVSGIRPAASPYMLSKWGLNGLTEGMAKELIKYGIVVNGIAPGPTVTEMLSRDLNLAGKDLMYEGAPAKRFADPYEIANLAVFLISDMGRMIVGDTVCISGGCGNLTVDDIKY